MRVSMGIGYTYDSAGPLSTATYPAMTAYSTPPTYTYGYDGMGRPVSMTDNTTNPYMGVGVSWVQNGQYDAAGHMTSMAVFSGNTVGDNPAAYWANIAQTMGYNVNGQLTSMNWAYLSPYTSWFSRTIQYAYSTTANNGQITQMTDYSGETVSYAYDALKRLTGATAVTGGSTAWTQAFGYDGFGNMTSKSLNGGANMAPAIDPTTNRLTSGYDANGNMLSGYGLTLTYDERNRLASASPTSSATEYYGYAPDNKRIYRWNPSTGAEEWTFYGARGERIGAFALNTSGSYYFYATETNVWFGGKLISKMGSSGGLASVMRDRLGSDREAGSYYPYGEDITSSGSGTEKFGTYFRDSFTTMDYADQRYYVGAYGRFNTADPYQASAGPSEPGSWNRYSYVEGDPINFNDRSGQMATLQDGCFSAQYQDSCYDFADGSSYAGGITPGCTQSHTINGFNPLDPNPISTMNCYGGLFGSPVFTTVAASQSQQPTCSISLYERPVGGPAGALGAYHTYLDIQDSSGNETIEAGPDLVNYPFGYLVGKVSNPPGKGLAGTDPSAANNLLVGASYSGSLACSDAQTIDSVVANYDSSGVWAIYNPVPALGPGYNSNSFTFTLLSDVGLSLFFGQPSSTPGWGYLVPGLQ